MDEGIRAGWKPAPTKWYPWVYCRGGFLTRPCCCVGGREVAGGLETRPYEVVSTEILYGAGDYVEWCYVNQNYCTGLCKTVERFLHRRFDADLSTLFSGGVVEKPVENVENS